MKYNLSVNFSSCCKKNILLYTVINDMTSSEITNCHKQLTNRNIAINFDGPNQEI